MGQSLIPQEYKCEAVTCPAPHRCPEPHKCEALDCDAEVLDHAFVYSFEYSMARRHQLRRSKLPDAFLGGAANGDDEDGGGSYSPSLDDGEGRIAALVRRQFNYLSQWERNVNVEVC